MSSHVLANLGGMAVRKSVANVCQNGIGTKASPRNLMNYFRSSEKKQKPSRPQKKCAAGGCQLMLPGNAKPQIAPAKPNRIKIRIPEQCIPVKAPILSHHEYNKYLSTEQASRNDCRFMFRSINKRKRADR